MAEAFGSIEHITVSRVMKYQEDAGHAQTSQNILREAIKKAEDKKAYTVEKAEAEDSGKNVPPSLNLIQA